ncbi:MAG: carbohydrate ABC transporter permease, partial [Anaerolineaceae bacterium]|nr:carbohydrate ABC transporter permease [Anaerolineaceae bacterium]
MSAITSQARLEKRPLNWGRIGSYAFLVLMAIVYLGPLLMLVNTSLKTTPSFMRDPLALASEFRFQNFIDAWNKANFPKYLLNTVIYTASATTIYVVTAVFVAFPIARGYVKHSGWLLTMFVVALFLPPALIPQFQLIRALGLYNTQFGYIMLFIV